MAETSTFYDQHPFDWASIGPDTDIHLYVSPLLVKLIDTLDVQSLVLDVGCGPGRVLGFLAHRGFRCIGIDRSRVSIGRAVQRYGRPGVVADNLNLPLPFPDALRVFKVETSVPPAQFGRHGSAAVNAFTKS